MTPIRRSARNIKKSEQSIGLIQRTLNSTIMINDPNLVVGQGGSVSPTHGSGSSSLEHPDHAPPMTLAEELALLGSATAPTEPNANIAEMNRTALELMQSNQRIMALQREVIDQRLLTERAENERLKYENEILLLQKQLGQLRAPALSTGRTAATSYVTITSNGTMSTSTSSETSSLASDFAGFSAPDISNAPTGTGPSRTTRTTPNPFNIQQTFPFTSSIPAQTG